MIDLNTYKGSPAEQEDRRDGIKLGGIVEWLVTGPPMHGRIIAITQDEDGDPWFTLSFLPPNDDHKDVTVERREILPPKLQRRT